MCDVVADAWQHHAQYLLARCRLWMEGDRDKAQEAFSRAWLRVTTYYPRRRREIGDVRSWLVRVTYHACMDVHREARRRAEDSLDGPLLPRLVSSHTADPERALLGKERLSFLSAAYEQLPERLREALRSYLLSSNYRDIAHGLGITEDNARKRVHEARTILRRQLADYDAGHIARVQRRCANERAKAVVLPLRTTAVRAVTRPLPRGGLLQTEVLLTAVPHNTSPARLRMLLQYVDRHPAGWKRQLDLARILVARGAADAAIPHFLASALRKPTRADIWIDLASVLLALGRGPEVRLVWQHAAGLALAPGELALLAGFADLSNGDRNQARQHFEAAHQLAPHAARPLVELARIAFFRRQTHDGLELLDLAMERDPSDVAALVLGHGALRTAGREADAHERHKRAAALDPELAARNAGEWRVLAMNDLAAGAIVDARARLDLLAELDGGATDMDI